jgi:hypothetical protein
MEKTDNSNLITFKHGGTSGDLIYWLACVKKAYERYGKKAVIYQWMNCPGFFYEGASHPYKGVMMNDYAFDMLKPLLLAQPYIEDFRKWNGEPCMIDMDKVRTMKPLMPYGNIIKWLGYCYGDIMPDVSKAWIGKPSEPRLSAEGKIVINKTSRYSNQWINYFFLKKYEKDLLFVGLFDEYEAFQNRWNLEIAYAGAGGDFNDLAMTLNSCKFFIGNQSMCFAVAEAMKVPRILEVCPFAPNVDPVGGEAYDFMYQEFFEYHVKDLFERL